MIYSANFVRIATVTDIFRFSATTWNAHRIHLDNQFALSEGLPGVVVQAHLHGAWFGQIAREVGGHRSRLRSLEWKNKRAVTAGQSVFIERLIVNINEFDDGRIVQMTMTERNSSGEICAEASASVLIIKGD
jgi:hydroxyacyl-ACP dehydratase HTD2-like protein with hotdog domain